MRIASISSLAVTALVGMGALVMAAGPLVHAQPAPSAAATLRTAAGGEIGRATFTVSENGAIIVDLSAAGLQPGFHGFHVHSAAKCDGPDFASAGGHLGAMDHAMGMGGDLPSLLVNDDGTGSLRAVTERFSIDDLLAGAGTSVIVHAGPDNFGNIPTRYAPAPDATTLATGDAGPRIACGIVQPA